MSRTAETPAPNRWPRGSIIRAFGRRAVASVGMADGIWVSSSFGLASASSRSEGEAYQTNPTRLLRDYGRSGLVLEDIGPSVRSGGDDLPGGLEGVRPDEWMR